MRHGDSVRRTLADPWRSRFVVVLSGGAKKRCRDSFATQSFTQKILSGESLGQTCRVLTTSFPLACADAPSQTYNDLCVLVLLGVPQGSAGLLEVRTSNAVRRAFCCYCWFPGFHLCSRSCPRLVYIRGCYDTKTVEQGRGVSAILERDPSRSHLAKEVSEWPTVRG